MREVHFQRHFTNTAAGSVLVSFGETRVLCTAMIEEQVPEYRKASGLGWLTAEYQMLPGSTPTRKPRKTDGRATEISRLIGRALRACVDFSILGPRTVWIDCDVLQADGGTRTAAITGGFVALHDAVQKKMAEGLIAQNPLKFFVAALSVGFVDDELIIDLDYKHDSRAQVDMNVVGNSNGDFIEVQGTGEEGVFSRAQMNAMLDGASRGISELIALQKRALGV